jgi:uncharacterized membrane protein YagU involved in acid resistance
MSESFSATENKTRRIPFRIIFWTMILAGSLDIAAAIINSNLRAGTSPVVVLQFIASGVLGRNAFSGGISTAVLGLIFHYLITFIWTFIFFVFYPKLNFSPKYKIPSGLLYGLIIWLIMNLIVLPLSNVPRIQSQVSQIIIGISFIMFLVGLPISLIFHKYYRNK